MSNKLGSYFLFTVCILSICLSTFDILNVNKRSKQLDAHMKAQLNVMVNSHFIGCGRVSTNFQLCHELSEQYREQIKKDLGL